MKFHIFYPRQKQEQSKLTTEEAKRTKGYNSWRAPCAHAIKHEMNAALHNRGKIRRSIDEKNILANCHSSVRQKNIAAEWFLLLL